MHSVPGRSNPRSVLLQPAFLRLWISSATSGIATWAFPFVLGLAVATADLDAITLGWILAARTIGFLLAVPFAGLLADQHSPRSVITGSGLLSAVATGTIAIGLAWPLAALTLAAALIGVGQGAGRPALQSMTALVVAEDSRQTANAALTFAVRLTVLVGPAAVALAARHFSFSSIIVGVALLWLVVAISPPPVGENWQPCLSHGNGPKAVWLGLTEGVTEARRHRWFVAGLAALVGVVMFGYSATNIVLPLISKERFTSDWLLVYSITGYTAGALVGAVLLGIWRPKALGWWSLAGLGLYGFTALSMGLSAPAWVIIATYVFAGFGIEVFNVPWFTATQREVAPDKLARVSSLDFLVSYGLAPVGLALIAPATEAFGTQPVLLVTAAVCFLGCGLAALVPGAKTYHDPKLSEK